MSLPTLKPFVLPSQIYIQEDFYSLYNSYYTYIINYNTNLLQFATGLYITPIQDYIISANTYIILVKYKAPEPFANPWNVYLDVTIPPTPPSTIGWEQSQIDIVNAITDATTAFYDTTVQWYAFIVDNKPPPQYLSNNDCELSAAQYADLLIRQYAGLRKAWSTIAYVTYYNILNTRTIFDVTRSYDPRYGVGEQLDFIGNFFSLSRNVSFKVKDIEYTTLTDQQFKIVLFFSILCFNCNFSWQAFANATYTIFQNQVTISSDYDMTITYYVIAPIYSDMYVAISYLASLKKLPAPLGVQVKYVILSDNPKPFLALTNSITYGSIAYLEYGLGWSDTVDDNILLWSGDIL